MGYKVSIWLQALTVNRDLCGKRFLFFVPLKSIFFPFFSVIFWCNFSPFWHLDYVCVSLSRTYIAQSLKSIGIRNFFFHWDSNAYSMFEVCILTTYVLQPLWWSIPYISWYPPWGPWKLAITLFYDTLWR